MNLLTYFYKGLKDYNRPGSHGFPYSVCVLNSEDKGTIILDARSSNRFEQLHIAGSKNLPFTDFTKETLKAVIPSKDSKILIYCNNNVLNSPAATN